MDFNVILKNNKYNVKGGVELVRKMFATSLDVDLMRNFRALCGYRDLRLNRTIEALIRDFLKDAEIQKKNPE